MWAEDEAVHLLEQFGLAVPVRDQGVDTAKAFGLTDRGAIVPGSRADLLLIDGDPLADISATRRIRAIWCAGTEIKPATGREGEAR